MSADDSRAALWFAVVALGAYHGLNPAMGWPLAVASGLQARRDSAVLATIAPLGIGHFGAMAIVLVPFALLDWLLAHGGALRIALGLAVALFGVVKLLRRRHPRFIARVRPSRVALWSFLMASAHGAGLMLLPITLGLCGSTAAGGAAAGELMRSSAAVALVVAAVHTLAMVVCGVAIAWVVYRWLGLKFLERAWLNLDVVWGASLVIAGGAGVIAALVR